MHVLYLTCVTVSDQDLSLAEYLSFRCMDKTHTPESLAKISEEEFVTMDKNGDGTVDWWEFLQHEASKRLEIQPKVSQWSCNFVNDYVWI